MWDHSQQMNPVVRTLMDSIVKQELKVLPKNDDDVVVTQRLRTYTKLDFDIKTQFLQYLKLKYNGNKEAIELNSDKEFDDVVSLGLIQTKQKLFSYDSILLHKERKPRKDVWKKLGKVAAELLNCHTYPKIPSVNITGILNKALGERDYRVIDDYHGTVMDYSQGDNIMELDVALFVSLIPKQYITSSSSSLED